MTLEELLAQMPEPVKPWAEKYGPTILAWTAQEVMEWIALVAAGDIANAYGHLVSGMSNDELLAVWGDLEADWSTANTENTRKIAVQKEAVLAIVKVALGIALASVGL